MDWSDDACCSGIDADVFFAADDFTHPEMTSQERYSHNQDNRLRQQVICAPCPVREQCLDYAVRNGITDGTWGGLTAAQRLDARRPGARGQAAATGQQRYAYHGPLTPTEARMVAEVRAGATFAAVADRHGTTVDQVKRHARKGLAASATV